MTHADHNDRFDQERSQTFDRILAVIEAKTKAISPALITDIHSLSPGSMQESAEREAWELLAKGLRHLKDGAPDGQPGSMAGALSRSSLRNSALAASLGVKQPQFEQMYFQVDYSTGHEAALFYTKRLIEAAEGDFSKSRQIIQQKISSEKPFGAFGIMTDVDPELSEIFDAVRKSTGVDAQPKPDAAAVPHKDLAAMRKQTITSFNMLMEQYTEVCKTLRQELENIPAPKAPQPPKRGQSFDF